MSRTQQLLAWIDRALTMLESGVLSDLQRRNAYYMLGIWQRELRQ